MSLQSIEPDNFFGGGKIDAFDARARGEPGNILRRRQPLRALLQVFGDTLRHQFERQLAALVLTVQPNDMETVARRDRLRADRTGRKREQGLLEFRRGLADCDLAKVAALRSRWARRVRLRQFGELLGMLMQDGERGVRGVARLRVTRRIGAARSEQDVSRFVDGG
jgi:hypothetical protein